MKGQLIDTVAEFWVYCPQEKEQGYRAEQVLSPCQPVRLLVEYVFLIDFWYNCNNEKDKSR